MAWRRFCSRIPSPRKLYYSTGQLQKVFPVIACADNIPKAPIAQHLALYDDIRSRRHRVLEHAQAKVGGIKKTARERVALLADEGSKVLEVGQLAGLGLPYGDVPCGANVVCITEVCGETCIITANDWTVKGGSTFPITLKKQLRAQEIAFQNRLPCIYLVDSGGAFLPLQSELYPDKEHGGRVFRNEAVLSSLGIPQVAVVTGSCTAGGAYVPSMCDEAVIVEGSGSMYLGGPPLVHAATGEMHTSEELGGANVHCSISGCTDHFARTEEEAVAMARGIVGALNLQHQWPPSAIPALPPLLAAADEDFSQLIPAAVEQPWPMLHIMARLVDGSRLQHFKEKFGCNLVTGFARINGHLVGVLGNQGPLDEASAVKGTHFVRLCSVRGIPLVFLVNTPSDANFLSPHGTAGLVAKAQAQMMSVVATAGVPKLTIVLGGCYGPSGIAMGGRCMEPNFLFCWPHARLAIASPTHLQQAMGNPSHSQHPPEQVHTSFHNDEALYPSSALYHDGIILPSETREVLSQCLAITSKYTTNQHKSPSLPVLRM